MSEHEDTLPALPEGDEPIPNPGLPPHQWRPTDVDPRHEKRAERQVAALFGVATLALLGLLRLLLRLPGRRRLGHDRRLRRLQPDARRHARHRVPLHRRRPDPLGPQADGRPRDGRAAPPGRPPARRTAPRRSAGHAGRRRLRHRPPPAGAQLAARRARPGRAGADPHAARPGSAARRQALPHHLEARHARRARRRLHADQGLRPRDRRPGQLRARGRRRTAATTASTSSRASSSRSPSPRAP